MTHVQNFIDGQYVEATSGETSPLVDPATGSRYGTAGIARSPSGGVRLRRTGRRRCSPSQTTSSGTATSW